jgi:hypothetical protein
VIDQENNAQFKRWDCKPFEGRKLIRWEGYGRVYRSNGSTIGPNGSITCDYNYEQAKARLATSLARSVSITTDAGIEIPYIEV